MSVILHIDEREKSCYNILHIIHDFLCPDKSGFG